MQFPVEENKNIFTRSCACLPFADERSPDGKVRDGTRQDGKRRGRGNASAFVRGICFRAKFHVFADEFAKNSANFFGAFRYAWSLKLF